MGLENVDDVYPLTPMQDLMLVHATATPGETLLDNQFRYDVHGPLDRHLFERSWRAVVDRHPALRTAIVWDGVPHPLQVVRSKVELPFEYVDLTSDSPEMRGRRLDALIAADARRPHTLSRAPLLRCTLVRTDEQAHHFVWNAHHLIVDRWSHEVIFTDVDALYAAWSEGRAPELPPAGRVRDYMGWLRRQSEAEAEDFWRRQLRGFSRASRLTAPPLRRGSGRRVTTRHRLPAARRTALDQRAAEWKTTGNTVLLGAVAVTLARRTGSSDVAWGLAVSGRPPQVEGIEHTVGSFVGNVPLRTLVDPEQTTGDWVRDLRSRQVAMQRFEHVSPATIRGVAPLPSSESLFDLLVVPNQEASSAIAPRPTYTMHPAGASFDGAYPLVLGLLSLEAGIDLVLVHDESFTEATDVLADLAAAVEALLDAHADARLGEVFGDLPARPPRHAATRPLPTGATAVARTDAHSDPMSVIEAIWRDVLGLTDVDLDADLFELGGTSLQATRIFAALERALRRPAPLSLLLRARTIRTLAAALTEGDDATGPGDGPKRDSPGSDEIPKLTDDAPVALSFAQERLWILDQMDGRSSVYNLAEAFRIRGPLSSEALHTALGHLGRRHAVLRTAYPQRDGEPVQVVDDRPLDWAVIDGTHLPEEALHARLAGEAWKPFELASGPLFRARLVRLGEGNHVLLLAMHHSISDGWSMGVLRRELGRLYDAQVAGESISLPVLPLRYGDVAAWQRERLTGDRLDTHVAYWRRTLDGAPPLDLPTDRPRPAIQTFRGGVVRTALGGELVERLRAVARGEGTTLYTALMAAFHVLLARYSSQSDVVVATPFAGRTRTDLEPIVGMFVNTLAIRSDCRMDRSFRDLLREVRERTLEAHGQQDLPFEKLVEELQPPRDLSRNPIVQVLFSLEDAPPEPLRLEGLEVSEATLDQETSKFDLSLYLREGGDGLEGLWEYAADLFDPSTIARMHHHFEVLLAAAARDPDQAIGALPLMEGDEVRELVVDWNETFLPVDGASTHHRVGVQAGRTPDTPAVSDAATTLTYAELDERANRLAHHLVDLGVEPGDLVALRLPRSVDSVIAVLATLKAGAAFLPLDPDFPIQRSTFTVDDAGAALLLTTTDLATSFAPAGVRTVCLDREADEVADRPATPPPTTLDPAQLAYVIYTSGSTGRPKGVEVTHANLSNFLAGMVERPGLAGGDTVLAVTTLAFDISLLELLGPLTVGAHVRIASEDDVASGERLRAHLERGDVTLMQATPATWQMLFDAGWVGDGRLRSWVGGDVLPRPLARRMAAECAEVWNMYGPTETTVWSSCWRVPPDADAIRIGSPIANTTLYVLDDRMQPLPLGVPGELCIGGEGVARGYRGRPALTAERFVPDPFATTPGARLYRTGDRVRLGADLELEYLERTDRQVKIRGFRIELGEIETVLGEHDAIQQSVVVGRGTGTLDARLVAYVVLEPAAYVTASEIRRFLRARVPDYMVPGFVVELDAFPLTPNGKVDRAALPDPLSAATRAAASPEPPQTPHELLIARVWSALLELDGIGRGDNFYELGGHSLLGLKAAAAIRRESGHEIDPRAMFFQTLGQLAEQLDRSGG